MRKRKASKMINYQDSAALMTDAVFIGRVKAVCVQISAFIIGEDINVPAHNTRVRWAQATFDNPDQQAYKITPITVLDPAVQQDGGNVSDAALHAAVDAALNKLI